MITTERDVFIGAHFTKDQKESFRREADRRQISMSALLSQLVEDWLEVASQEQVEPKRSNKKAFHDVALPLGVPCAVCDNGKVKIQVTDDDGDVVTELQDCPVCKGASRVESSNQVGH